MRLVICSLLCAGALGLCLAVPERTVRWCTVSNLEASKCYSFHDNMKKVLSVEGPHVTCVKRTSYLDCIRAIAAHEADAVMVDGGLVYEAGLKPYNLKPVVAEFYGSKDDPQTHHYVVAVVKKGSNFQLNQLQGKKSCHTGLGWSAGWNIPMRMLLPSDWSQEAAAKFFAGSCVPCADQSNFPRLCQLCAGKGMDKCACSHREPYFGYSGAFKCLQDGVGDVSFVRHLTVFENLANQADRDQYELLCRENTRRPVHEYKGCHLARIPSHAVVARSVDGKEDLIWELLSQAQEHFGKDKSAEFQLFYSPHGKDLLFTDSAIGFLRVPPKMDAKLYLGYEYFSVIQHLGRVSQDGKEQLGSKCVNTPMKGYYVVAVVKKSDANLTWNSLRGKKSCHTAVGTSAGWNIPMGFLYNQTGSCKLDEFFSQSCAPGSDPESSLCALCRGSFKPAHMCAPNSHEQYYGSSGALRCLVEKGDVAFVKHPTVLQNTDGKNPEAWAKNLKPEDFQLLCLDGSRKPVTEAQSCHLAIVPSHAVVSRKDKADFVRRMLFNQQELFGRNGFEYMMFQLFKSPAKDLLFSDDTECLANLQDRTTYQKYLGPEYLQAIANVKHCLRSELLDACTFHGN
ncbi:inhibitor of carbonic anhydrase precursor [Bos taurus]|uniref:Serotransferrin-like n=1 Tax=Bos taurus TaxID=9913 RepID=Q2HJF0_BOVIN|nr:inhibitor of carbonic anhydrase precursor [Bos taurus]AAI05494.1 Serotransferrin-like [Bos taurus]